MDLARKYRPQSFDDVLGQASVVRSLSRLVRDGEKQAFALVGPSGTGKTTLARIAARGLGCAEQDLMEIDAASHTGIDAWREIRAQLRYAPMGGRVRAVIVDEAHKLSAQAWQSLLKDIEEPPPHVVWFVCTTEEKKIPKTIANRCAMLKLRPVSGDDIFARLVEIRKAEGLSTSDDILDECTEQAMGSVRQAIAFLEVVQDCDTLEEAGRMLESAAASKDPIELARGLLQGTMNWTRAVSIVRGIDDSATAEGIRRMMIAYMAKALLGTTSRDAAEPILAVIDVFGTPFASDARAPEVLIPIGQLLK